MGQAVRYSWQLVWLQAFVWFKRSLCLLIRSVWLGLAGYLLAWGLGELGVRFFDEKSWKLVGIVFASLPLVGILFSWPRIHRFVWSLDQKFVLKEQISTAWSVSKGDPESEVVAALLVDASSNLPHIWKRLLFHGWHLWNDLVALCLVLILGAGVYVYRFLPVTAPSLDAVEVAMLPALGSEAKADDIFPTGILGVSPTPTPEGSDKGAGNVQGDAMSNEFGQMQEALAEMGERLSQAAATYELGQSLQEGDLDSAATALENIADQLSALDASTINTLAAEMSTAAGELSSSGEEAIQELSQDLVEASIDLQLQAQEIGRDNEASESESSPEDIATQDALDAVAGDLRSLDEIASGLGGTVASGSNSESDEGEAEPFARILGEGDEFSLENDAALQPGILIPADPHSSGYQTSTGALDYLAQNESDVVRTPLVPSYYTWKWRYVVSTYFLHR